MHDFEYYIHWVWKVYQFVRTVKSIDQRLKGAYKFQHSIHMKKKMIYKRKSVEKYIFVLEKNNSTVYITLTVWEWQWHTSLCVFRRIHPRLKKMAEKVNFLLSDCLNSFSIYEIWTGKIDGATYIQILISVFQPSLSIDKIYNMLSAEIWSTKNMKIHEQYYRLQKCVSIWLKLKVSWWTCAKIFTFYVLTQKERSVTQFWSIWLVLFISSLDKTATIISTLPSFHLCTK